MARKAWPFILAIALLAWTLYTMRPEALLASIAFLFALFSRSFRGSNSALLFSAFFVFAIPFSPIGITTMYAYDGPKMVTCCPGLFASQRGHEQAIEDSLRGKCRLCTDLVTGFEAKLYLVW